MRRQLKVLHGMPTLHSIQSISKYHMLTSYTCREGLMFYELNTADVLGNSPWKRTSAGELNWTFHGQLDIFAQISTLVDPNVQFINPATNNTNDPAAPSPVASTGIVVTDAAMATGTSNAKGAEFAATGGIIGSLLSFEVRNVLPDG